MTRIRLLLAPLFLLLSSAAQAVTYIVPSDREMIQQSDDIVLATGVTSLVERNAHGAIVTRFTLRIESVLKGDRAAGDHLVLTERGGVLDHAATFIPGTPRYQPGERYLVFTETNADHDPITYGMSLGQFFFHADNGRLLALRTEIEGYDQNFDAYTERARDAAGFLAYIRGIVAQSIDPQPRYFVGGRPRVMRSEWETEVDATRASYLMADSGRAFRWSVPSATIVKAGTQPGVNVDAGMTQALAQWNGTDSDIDYRDGGQDDTATGGISNNVDTSDGKNAVLFNDPNGQAPNTVAGSGGITLAGDEYSLGGEDFWDIVEVDVVMNNITFVQNCFNSVLTHELGHTLGFRHSNQNQANNGACAAPLDCATSAIMNSGVSCGFNGVLRNWDRTAAATSYGQGVVCNAPSIVSQPVSQDVRFGTAVSLRVTAAGSDPFSYQWFQGGKGDTSIPVGSNRTSFLTPSTLTAPTSFWVRVTNSCGSADSNAATITPLRGRRRAVAHP
jgi:hypothetical protein